MELDVVEMSESILLSYSKHTVPIPYDGKNEEHRNRRQDRIVITQICD